VIRKRREIRSVNYVTINQIYVMPFLDDFGIFVLQLLIAHIQFLNKYKAMKKKEEVPSSPMTNKNNENEVLPGYPLYPESEDVYSKWKEESEISPEDPSKLKVANEIPSGKNEKEFSEDVSGGDLDVPGAELDDAQENVGSEDEENNYYSLGGDNHDGV